MNKYGKPVSNSLIILLLKASLLLRNCEKKQFNYRKKMKLKLIAPGQIYYYTSKVHPLWYPSLGMPIIAALTPAEWEVSITDGEEAEHLDFDEDVDLVGIHTLTPHANKAYEVADSYRERKVKTVLGGPHPTGIPGEAKQHADAVVIGEGDNVWHQLLEDVKKGELKDFYRSSDFVNPAKIPLPRIDLLDTSNYAGIHPLMPSRGCPLGCDFCLTSIKHGRKMRERPLENVAQELELVKKKRGKDVSISVLENPQTNKAYMEKLCAVLETAEVKWSVEAHLPLLGDENYLKMLKKANCHLIYTQIKAITKDISAKKARLYEENVKKVRDAGIELTINFMIGYDDHEKSVFFDVWDFVEKCQPTALAMELITPWPGTPLFKRLKNEGRIRTEDWSQYDNAHVVFQPKRMTMDEMYWGYVESIQRLRAQRELELEKLGKHEEE
jgi:radical SAM superfamily enzyme YgiQ (UPF0313 family)